MAALIGTDMSHTRESEHIDESLDGVPLFDDRPIDFSGGAGLDGEPMVCCLYRVWYIPLQLNFFLPVINVFLVFGWKF